MGSKISRLVPLRVARVGNPRPSAGVRVHGPVDYFCVDLESSGPIPGIHNLLSLGVTHVRRFQGTYQPFEDLYVEFRPLFPGYEDAAMAVNKLDPKRLESEGLSMEEGISRILDFVAANQSAKKERPVFVAHNAPFDWMFFTYYCGHAGFPNPFGYSAIDTKPLAMGKLNIPWNQTTLKNVRTLVGVDSIDLDKLHHAGEDARYLSKIFSALMNREPGAPV